MSAELFHDGVSTYLGCGRLDIAKISPALADYFMVARGIADRLNPHLHVTHPGLPPIYFDFIDSEDFNAYAFKHKDHRFIGVTAGTVVGLGELFNRMMSDRRILTMIGDPTVEAELPALLPPALPNLFNELHKNGRLAPRDAVRRNFRDFLFQVTFEVLFLHEFTHIRNGHLDYRHAQGNPFLPELGYTPVSHEESVELQALECDADTGAAGFATNVMHQLALNPPQNNPHLKTLEAFMCGLAVSITSLFRLFTDAPIAGAKPFTSTHPPVRYRHHVAVAAIEGQVRWEGRIPTQKALVAVAKGQLEADKAFHFMTGENLALPQEDNRYLEGWSETGQRIRECLRTCWEGGLRKQLKAYAYGSPMQYDPPSA